VIGGVLLALAFLLVVVPWQGGLDRLGESSGAPPVSGAPDFVRALVTLTQEGGWWRVEPAYSTFLVLHRQYASGDGPSVVGAYGPWGFLYRGYAPGNYTTLIVAWSFLAIAFSVGLAGFLRRVVAERWLRVVVALVVLMLMSANPRAALPLVFPVLVLLLLRESGGRAGRGPAGGPPALRVAGALEIFVVTAACALASLIFSPVLVLSKVVMAAMAIEWIAFRRRLPWFVLIFSALFFVFGVFARETVPVLLRYAADAVLFRWSAEAAGIDGVGVWVAVGAVVLVVFDAFLSRRVGPGPLPDAAEAAAPHLVVDSHFQEEAAGVAIAKLFAIVCLLKAGVAIDGVAREIVLGSLGVVVVLLCVRVAERFGGGARAGLILVVGCAAVIAVGRSIMPPGELLRQFSAAKNPWAARGRADLQYAVDLRSIALRNSLGPVKGTADIYPDRASVLVANRTKVDPRPFFQSELADTPARGEANANHLRGADAPQWIVFEVGVGQLPALQDSLSWPEILTRYDLRAAIPGAVVFERAKEPRAWRSAPLGRMSAALGAGVAIPGGAATPVWARIVVRPTILGRVASMVYAAPPLLLHVQSSDGEDRSFPMNRRLAGAGFLLSPLVLEPIELGHLHVGRWSMLQRAIVSGIRVEAAPWAYSREVDIELQRVELTAGPWVR
jgi:hypothetical protein